jgi:hypothetical protein
MLSQKSAREKKKRQDLQWSVNANFKKRSVKLKRKRDAEQST